MKKQNLKSGADLLESIIKQLEVIRKEMPPTGPGHQAANEISDLCFKHQHYLETDFAPADCF